jgi:hypothetical protein
LHLNKRAITGTRSETFRDFLGRELPGASLAAGSSGTRSIEFLAMPLSEGI